MVEPRERPSSGLNRVLVVKLADMGDAILATSAVAALRRTYAHARIDVLTAGAGASIFRLCGAVDDVVTLDKQAFDRPAGLLHPHASASMLALVRRLRARRYDAIAVLHHLTTPFGARKFRWLCAAIGAPIRAGLDNGRGDFLTHRAIDLGFGTKSVHDYGLDVVKLLGAGDVGARPSLSIPDDARKQIDALLLQHGMAGEFIVIHPSVGAYAPARNWYPDRFATVAGTVHNRFGYRAVLVGAAEDSDVSHYFAQSQTPVNLVGQTTVPQLAALLSRAKLVIGADSGVVHLASALVTPTIAIFGPSNHAAWAPVGAVSKTDYDAESARSTTVVVRSGIPCSPCFYTGFSLGRRDGCPLRTCLDLVSAESVTEIAIQLLSQTAHRNSSIAGAPA